MPEEVRDEVAALHTTGSYAGRAKETGSRMQRLRLW